MNKMPCFDFFWERFEYALSRKKRFEIYCILTIPSLKALPSEQHILSPVNVLLDSCTEDVSPSISYTVFSHGHPWDTTYRFAETKKNEKWKLRPSSPLRCDGEKVGDDFKEADKRRRRRSKSKKNICGDIPLRRKMTQGVAFEDDDVHVGPIII